MPYVDRLIMFQMCDRSFYLVELGKEVDMDLLPPWKYCDLLVADLRRRSLDFEGLRSPNLVGGDLLGY